MYGLIGRMLATPGKRDELLAAMSGDLNMPGCLSYIIAEDAANPDALWITEVWDNAESHAASLQIPEVQAMIGKARPLIAGLDNRVETKVVSGV
jgi:quinol monooxygenase YgiN